MTETTARKARPTPEELENMLLEKSTMDIAEELGVSRTTVCVWINDELGPNRAQELWLKRRTKLSTERAETLKVKRVAGAVIGTRPPKYTDDDIKNAILKIADGAQILTAARYSAERDKDTMPSAPIIMRRFGTWNAAIKAAGLEPIVNRGRQPQPQDTTGVAPAVAYLSHCYKNNQRASFTGVKEFAKSRGIPSTAVCRGRWSDLKAEALRRWDEFTDEPKFWEGFDVKTETGRSRWTGDGLENMSVSKIDERDELD